MESAFELTDVRKRFRLSNGGWNDALNGITLSIRPGEFIAIIGPSGAGKTTLLRLMNLTLRPDSGDVRVSDLNPADLNGKALRTLRARTGTIYQQHNLIPTLRAVHNILAGRLSSWSILKALYSLLSPRETTSAAEVAQKVGVLAKLWERTDRLSGGEQQRVAIARALIQNPSHLLADEPIASVDPSRADALIQLLRELSEEDEKTVVVNLHDVPVALRHFPRIIGLHAGEVFFDLPPEGITENLLVGLYEGDEEIPEGEARAWIGEAMKESLAG
ncbi:MAG: phosphonate ABC transporter ATP-binding protein [Nitrospinaceae bacterium]|jgi:phosphonate transport system ATP-binding protein|nr:phosphonate ABC transporter ATP-binding protein [Nitrospinaceae bacterium]MBT3435644.1 phosphonate ABC transporter ATP-binding protein [Nitrospinaceae bacterium]MBT4428988.1 phosphonate ABC transporter ATP-binding protein [Nitrospinaceae bacterium]MBT5947787.1 phosphonate ABC transporter ATP-binding protein [Nitrospinaceae bacterium]MBT6394352.1 phosphonate ABC transporter ATP-binding protein [Nitrospinaceae bacterium]